MSWSYRHVSEGVLSTHYRIENERGEWVAECWNEKVAQAIVRSVRPTYTMPNPTPPIVAETTFKGMLASDDAAPECPGPKCLMCNGAACNKCGAGYWDNSRSVHCKHDGLERHEPISATERKP